MVDDDGDDDDDGRKGKKFLVYYGIGFGTREDECEWENSINGDR